MTPATTRAPWLPDLCRLPRIALVLGAAELTVLVIVLAPDGSASWSWARFASMSGFALWLALTIAVLLCVTRVHLSRLPQWLGGLLAVALAATTAAIGAWMLYTIDQYLGYGLVPAGVSLARFMLGSAAVSALIAAVLLRYLYAIDGWQAQVRASALARVDALQARIRPHFLFNSMNTIAVLIRRDPALAERAVLDLSDLFRAALGAGQDDSTLAEEVELAERYLAIETLRLDERLRVAWHKHEPLPWQQPMPRLVLQPLVENAVLHGITRLPQGGTVEIELSADERDLHVSVCNPAPQPRPDDEHGAGARHAQNNIGLRLNHAFGASARMTAGWQAGYYRVELRVPLGTGPA